MPIVAYPYDLRGANRTSTSIGQLLLNTASGCLRARVHHTMLRGRCLRKTVVMVVVMNNRSRWLI